MTRKREPMPAVKPYPCETPGCAGVLAAADAHGVAIDHERDGADRWVCDRSQGEPAIGATPSGCGFSVAAGDGSGTAERCPADGAPLRFDAEIVGETCGGLRLRGWNRCDHCGGSWVTRRGRSDDGRDRAWRLASSGVSLDAGGVRLRGEAGKTSRDELGALMTRIARLPLLEDALHRIADMRGPAGALARDVLGIGVNAPDGEEPADGG